MIKLYSNPYTCSVAVYIALELINTEYTVINVELGSSDYKKIAPKGAVPAMQDSDEGNTVMTQIGALLKYLSRKYPDSVLGFRGNNYQEYELDNALSFISSDLHSAYKPLFTLDKYSLDEKGKNNVITVTLDNIRRQLGFLDEMLKGCDYIVGNKLTTADIYGFVVAGWGNNFLPEKLDNYKNIKRHQEKIGEIKEVKKVLSSLK